MPRIAENEAPRAYEEANPPGFGEWVSLEGLVKISPPAVGQQEPGKHRVPVWLPAVIALPMLAGVGFYLMKKPTVNKESSTTAKVKYVPANAASTPPALKKRPEKTPNSNTATSAGSIKPKRLLKTQPAKSATIKPNTDDKLSKGKKSVGKMAKGKRAKGKMSGYKKGEKGDANAKKTEFRPPPGSKGVLQKVNDGNNYHK